VFGSAAAFGRRRPAKSRSVLSRCLSEFKNYIFPEVRPPCRIQRSKITPCAACRAFPVLRLRQPLAQRQILPAPKFAFGLNPINRNLRFFIIENILIK
jgi:hypothetical protein